MMQSRSDILQDEALELLMRATSGHATVGDLQELEAWRSRSVDHAEAYRCAMGIWERLGIAAGESVTAADRAMIAGRIHAERQAIGRRTLLVGGGAALAAAASLGAVVVRPPLGVWPSWSDLMADYHTGTGQQRTVTLVDGISVEMNTRTSIARRSVRDETERVELLSGEAAFVTPHNLSKPMTVIAADGQVTGSPGTRFNLRYDTGLVHVICLGGSVKVECGGAATTLHKEEQLAYSGQGIGSVAAADPTAATAWQRGLLIFRDEPLVQVLGEINRYWRGRIVLLNNDLGRRRVTVRIELARIDEVISYIHSVLGADVRTLPGGVVLLT
jgi:transmembrane sensor